MLGTTRKAKLDMTHSLSNDSTHIYIVYYMLRIHLDLELNVH